MVKFSTILGYLILYEVGKNNIFETLKKSIHIVGGGSAALSFACHIDTQKFDVFLYEKNKTLGRKFLVAGDGGLNITHSEPVSKMIEKYFPPEFVKPILEQFNNNDLIHWLNKIGIETFIGSSGRVFPLKNIKPIQVLNTIINQLKLNGVRVNTEHQLIDWNNEKLTFEHKDINFDIHYDVAVFSLGGGSWKITGSDGTWIDLFKNKGINCAEFESSNSSCYTSWKSEFISKNEGKYIKNISVKCHNQSFKGEIVLTKYGIEGACIYALNRQIREEIDLFGHATLLIDLKPGWELYKLKEIFIKYKKMNVSDILKNKINLNTTTIELLKSRLSKEEYLNQDKLINEIKNLKINILSLAPIDEAISTVGGINLDEINEDFELIKFPKTHCIGEMLNWDASTGGYLLQACFSMGKVLADKLNHQ